MGPIKDSNVNQRSYFCNENTEAKYIVSASVNTLCRVKLIEVKVGMRACLRRRPFVPEEVAEVGLSGVWLASSAVLLPMWKYLWPLPCQCTLCGGHAVGCSDGQPSLKENPNQWWDDWMFSASL